MARLPIPGKDAGTWGDILNEYLSQAHKSDGALKDNTVTASAIAPNTVTANEIQNGTIQEAQLGSAVQAKLNQVAPTWTTIGGKPAVIAAGATQADARTAIGAIGGNSISSAVDGQETTVSGGALTARNPLYIDPTQAPYNVKMDRYTTTSASMSSSTNPTQLTVSGYTFTAADIGKVIKVVGAGAAGANLKTTIAGIASGKAVLAAPCLTTVSNAYAVFGTDNHDALQALFTDLSFAGRGRKLSRTAIFPAGACLFSGTLVFPRRGTVKGAAENFVSHDIIYGAKGNAAEDTGGTVFHQLWDQNVDGFRFPDPTYTGDVWWNGNLQGFAVLQDRDNTAGKGINFVNTVGPVTVIDGGRVDFVSALGWAEEGFDFAGGSLPGTFKYLLAFACGYESRKDFTCDISNGSVTLSNISSMTGLAAGDILTGPGIPVDAIITSVNTGAGTVNINRAATATATAVAAQRLGAPGIRYKIWGEETLHFDCPSGDQNSGGLLRIDGPGGTYGAPITITALKNEFGTNVYKESRLDSVTFNGVYSYPQGSNAIVLNGANRASINIRGLTHWADASSSVGGTYPNTMGRDIGAAILDLNSGSSAPDVTWESLVVRGAPGSGQTVFNAFRDSRSTSILPIAADFTGKGTNRRKARALRSVADVNATVSVHDSIVTWSSLTGARTAALPAVSALAAGAEITLMDASGSASGSFTITATPNGADTIVGDTYITNPYGSLVLFSDGTKWIGRNPMSTRPEMIRGSNGTPLIMLTPTASAANYLAVRNDVAGGTPQIKAQGSDTNVGLMLVPQGTGAVQIVAGTGVTPRIIANGADTNHDLNLQSKGAGKVKANGVEIVDLSSAQTLTLKTLTDPAIGNSIKDINGNTLLAFNPVASAVNNFQISNDAASGTPQLRMVGTDTNIALMLRPKGTGATQIYADTGVTPRLTAIGADTNISLNLQPKGTGVVQANGVEIVTLTGTQTQTNKTLTQPKITAASGASPIIHAGAGTPEGVVTASAGSVYLRNDGGAATTFYVKESGTGNTGWVAK